MRHRAPHVLCILATSVLIVAILGINSTALAGPLSPDSLSGTLEIRAQSHDGEAGWLKRGYGKTGVGDARAGLEVGVADIVWQPLFSETLGGHFQVQVQPRLSHSLDVVEGYLTWRPPTIGETRLTLRAGLFFPPASLEHDPSSWGVIHTITPSAINTWIAEEVKVRGVELTARHRLGEGKLALNIAVFGGNDTAGALLAYRGWGLHDIRAGAFSELPLPPLSRQRMTILQDQAPFTAPGREIDSRAGYYGRLEWRSSAGLELNLFHYDNAGSRTGLSDGQYAWETRFTNAGAEIPLDDRTTLISQYLTGETKMGPRVPPILVNARFSSGFLMLTRRFGSDDFALRGEFFEVVDRSFVVLDNQNEQGRAITLAYIRNLSPHAQGRLELLTLQSRRPARTDLGLAARQAQTVAKASLRLGF